MTYIRILPNQNQIAFDYNNHLCTDHVSEHLKIRFIFNGKEQYTIGRRSLSLFPGSFLIFGEGTQFKQSDLSEKKIQSLPLSFSDEFLNQFKKNLTHCDNYLLPPIDRESI